MKYINNDDFLKILKSDTLKFENQQKDLYLNKIDSTLAETNEYFKNINYLKYLKTKRSDILKIQNPLLHFLEYCFIEQEIKEAYFPKLESTNLQDSRKDLEFFGDIDDFHPKINSKMIEVDNEVYSSQFKGYRKHILLSDFFSHDLITIFKHSNLEEVKNFVTNIFKFELTKNIFINIELNQDNFDFYLNSEILFFLKNLNVSICFDLTIVEQLNFQKFQEFLEFLNLSKDLSANNKFFLILIKNSNSISDILIESLLNIYIILLQINNSDLYFPNFFSEKKILESVPNKYYSKELQLNTFFYFGKNYKLFFEVNKRFFNQLNYFSDLDGGTLIIVNQLSVAGTEILSKNYLELLSTLELPVVLLFQKEGSLLSDDDFNKYNFLQVPISPVLYQKIISEFKLKGFNRIVSFTSVNLKELEFAESIGYESFIYLNENIVDLKLFEIDLQKLFNKNIPNRKIIVNSLSTSNVDYPYFVEIPTAIPAIGVRTSSEFFEKYTRNKLGIENKIVIGTLASGIFRKGIDRLQSILDILPDHMVYLWVGEIDPKYFPNSNKFINLNYLSRDNFFELIDIYSCLSRNDPFPMSVTEALIRRYPVVTYDNHTCGQQNTLDFKEILIATGDPKNFVEILLNTISDNKSDTKVNNVEHLIRRLRYSNIAFSTKSLKTMKLSFPSISVILPYYNHEKYIIKRLESIIDQEIPINEIIALNDCSTDKGFNLITDFLHNQEIFKFKILQNEINSGNVFRQWYNGILNATSDFIWIAETDDYANFNFLSELLPKFQNPEVVISTSNSNLVNYLGEIIRDSNHVFPHIAKIDKFNVHYINEGPNEILESLGIYNSIPNVSACLFKRESLLKAFESIKNTVFQLKYAGDWLLYVELLSYGTIAYNPKSLNYFRQHSKSVIRKADKDKLIKEIIFAQNFANQKVNGDRIYNNMQSLYLKNVINHLNSFE